ncbi:MAG: hypothetical protein LW809_03160 [Vampirovibrionales bacterium]|jgi:hypothetical protein|nr:hypothetical protein [Vampirovibrionales bacterium]
MASNNYLPQRPVDPSTYLNPAVNQQASVPSPPQASQAYQAPVPMQGSQNPYQANSYQGATQSQVQPQVQQWQNQQQQQQMQAQQGTPPPTPVQMQAYQAQRESQQKQMNVVNNTALGTIGFGTIGTGIALAETVLPQESDLSKPHVSKVGNVTYQVDLEEKPQGFVEKSKGLLGQGKDKELQVRRIANGNTSMHIKAYDPNTGKASLVAVDVSDGIQAHYEVDNKGQYLLKEVVPSRGRGREGLHLSPDDLEDLKKYNPQQFEALQEKLAKVKSQKKAFSFLDADYRKEVKKLKDQIAKLSAKQANHEALNLSTEEIDNLLKATNTIDLPDLNTVVKNAKMPHNIDWAEVFQKVLTKGGLGAILGGLAIGGGTWAFQTMREKSPEQKRIDALIAQNQANQLQPGRAPQQQGGQAIHPAMLANNGMYRPY